MTKIKLCGLSRAEDIYEANACHPDYIGFVFWPKSKRYVSEEKALELKKILSKDIQTVGVFLDEDPEVVLSLLERGIIDVAQLHGHEDQAYIKKLKKRTDKPILQAFVIKSPEDIKRANESIADAILVDSGTGSGVVFSWEYLSQLNRPYFLAGGLNPENVGDAVKTLHPYGVDVSSGIETDHKKDIDKMAAFVKAVRKEETL